MGKQPGMDTNKHEPGKTTEMGFEGLLGLFEQTQTVMQTQAARSVDIALVVRNWLFGWYIVAFENGGAERTDLYGKKLFKRLSQELKKNGLKGMSETNLRKFREFYQGYTEIQQTLPVTSLSSAKIQHKEALKKQLDEAQAEWEATHEVFSEVQEKGGATNGDE